MRSGSLTSLHHLSHTEMGTQFKVSFGRSEKQWNDISTPGLVVQCVIHYTTAAPLGRGWGAMEGRGGGASGLRSYVSTL